MSSDLTFPRPPIPLRAIMLSLASYTLPLAATLFFPRAAASFGVLFWLAALVPAFLLAYYRGWRGVSVALQVGVAVVILAELGAQLLGREIGGGPLVFIALINYVGVSLGIGWVSELLHRERALYEHLALTDELTELPNRRYARMVLDTELAAAQRGRPLAVVLWDLDHFKAYNDRHGHAAGDEALRTFAQVLLTQTRRMNLSARLGGEEFISVLSDCSVEGALIFIERVRRHLAATPPLAGPIRVSAGVATFHPGMQSVEELQAAADQALYSAKQAGRDCVRIYEVEELPVEYA